VPGSSAVIIVVTSSSAKKMTISRTIGQAPSHRAVSTACRPTMATKYP
jgi:hypothetical protein